MTTLLHSMPKSCPRQDAAVAAALRLGVTFQMRLSKEGWRIHARGPAGSATMLLPRERRSFIGPLCALCEQVGNGKYPGAKKGGNAA